MSKCKACGGWGTGIPDEECKQHECRYCEGTGTEPVRTPELCDVAACPPGCECPGTEPVALVEREVMEVCAAMETCPLRLEYDTLRSIASDLAYLVEHVHGGVGVDWGRRRDAALKKWKEVRG